MLSPTIRALPCSTAIESDRYSVLAGFASALPFDSGIGKHKLF